MNGTAATLEAYRPYLTVLAEMRLPDRLRGRLDAADVVQETMLRACTAFGELRSPAPEVVLTWLRRILASVLADAARHAGRDKRDVTLERSIERDLDRSSASIAGWLAGDATSPSQQAVRHEEVLRLAAALASLPADQREAVMLRHCDNQPIDRIAERMGRTRPAVAGLLRRGLAALREYFDGEK